MKRLTALAVCVLMLLSIVACSSGESASETFNGIGKGFGGDVEVTVTKDGDKIVDVKAVGESETEGIGSKAIDELPNAIVKANSTEVEVVSGATVSSEAVIYAVNNALDPESYPVLTEEVEEEKEAEAVTAADVYQGVGLVSNGRVGPGKDDQDVQVYSMNDVVAHTLFDEEGRILSINVDILEVATPNYDGEGMPHFSGFPGQGGYNFDENHDEVVDSITEDTEENFLAEVNGWTTKRERGDGYRLGSGTWAEEMDAFQEIFIGMTIDEVEEWFNNYTSDINGRPLVAESGKEEDIAKYEALNDEEKDMLIDIVASATMSLQDAHGDILTAIKESYENKVPVDVSEVASQGTAILSVPRVGPGKDDQDVSVYSINKVFANTLFDAEGKITGIYVDIQEIATPNYDGDGMPHFIGFPGQSYNNDENHDATVDGIITETDDSFLAEVEGWVTKRDRGKNYIMGTGTWTDQMDSFQDVFIGMNIEEVKEWFGKYTSDINGRPLKAESDKEEDIAKYEALSEEERDMLADVVSSATMSIQDPHGDILGAIEKSFENRVDINLTIE